MKSIDRASQLMGMKMSSVPAPAMAYAQFLGSRIGMCGEVFVTAYAHFAECCEGAEKSDGYAADDLATAFFAGYAAAGKEPPQWR